MNYNLTITTALLAAEIILEENSTSSCDYQSRTKSLDRRDMKKLKEKRTKDKDYIIEQVNELSLIYTCYVS